MKARKNFFLSSSNFPCLRSMHFRVYVQGIHFISEFTKFCLWKSNCETSFCPGQELNPNRHFCADHRLSSQSGTVRHAFYFRFMGQSVAGGCNTRVSGSSHASTIIQDVWYVWIFMWQRALSKLKALVFFIDVV